MAPYQETLTQQLDGESPFLRTLSSTQPTSPWISNQKFLVLTFENLLGSDSQRLLLTAWLEVKAAG